MAAIKTGLQIAYLRFRWWLARRKTRKLLPEPDLNAMSAAANEVQRYHLQIQTVITTHLENTNLKLGLDPPPEDWFYTIRFLESDAFTSARLLTPLGASKLRRAILLEKRMRLEFWLKLVPPIVSAVTSLLAIVVAILALILK